jgi:hypothetical protein
MAKPKTDCRLGVSTRAGATLYAVEHGLLKPD